MLALATPAIAPAPAWAAIDGMPPAGAGAGGQDDRINFDIPALPLTQAMDHFADLSGRSAVFPANLLAGRRSTPVQGMYAPEAALRLMLVGTGLSVETIRSGGITALMLREAPAAPAPVAPVEVDASALGGYEAVLQARVWIALCESGVIDGDRRSLLRFSVDPGGFLQHPRLLGSDGGRPEDRRLLEALRRVRLDTAPPPSLQQPVTLLILPEQAGGPSCSRKEASQ